jgi:hypothetical protein
MNTSIGNGVYREREKKAYSERKCNSRTFKAECRESETGGYEGCSHLDV